MSENYILFIFQEANFQSRSMLVPFDKFISVEQRKRDYDLLKKESINKKITINSQDHLIDHLLVQNYIKSNNSLYGEYRQSQHIYTNICNELMHYSDGLDDECYMHMYDKEWYDDTITNICGGFNHIKNYIKCKNFKEINNKQITIVDSFLVLESEQEKINAPLFDTVEEMLLSMYGYIKS
jgi:hypothetical protein